MRTIRVAIRALANTPGFATVAILTLAVGIAANVALFSIYDRLVLSPVSAPHPSTLVAIWSNNPQANFFAPALSWPRYRELERSTTSFASMGISAFDNFTLTGNGEQPDQLNGLRVSGAFFRTVGIVPARGRDFAPSEDAPNGPNVCIVSHELWVTRFGQRESLVGSTIQLNGQSWQVIGVTPPGVTAPFRQVQVFAPRVFEVSGLTPQQIDVGAGYAQPIARLKPGVTLEQATAELAASSRAYHDAFGGRLDRDNVSVPRDFTDALVGTLKPTFYTLLGSVGFVLLIACANVASLFLGRLAGRHKEIAVRQSLGATRASLVRHFVGESVVFSTVAGLIGIVLARLALAASQSLLASQVPPNTEFTLNWRAWVFMAAAALASALLVGLVPALQASKADVVETLKDASRGSSSGRGGALRSVLIVAEVALSVILLIGSTLLLVSFVSLQRTPPGFDPSGVATAFVGVPITRYSTIPAQAAFFERVVDRLEATPQIASASASLTLPINGGARAPYTVQGQPVLPVAQRPLANFQVVSEDFFKVMGIRLAAGRAFTAQDRDDAPGVCIINQTLANRLFAGGTALGRVLLRGKDATIASTIVGVIADVRSNGVNVPVPDEVYYPMRQLAKPGMIVSARTSGDPAAMQGVIRAAVAQVDRDQPISFFQTLDTAFAQGLGVQRIVADLTAVFAAIALVLAAVGLYAVVSYAAAQRTGEIGIRMALGARPGQVLSLIMSGGLRLVAIGLALGLAGGAGTALLIRALLANVHPLNPLVYAGVATLFGLVAAAACLVPSWRASRIDPILALTDRRVMG